MALLQNWRNADTAILIIVHFEKRILHLFCIPSKYEGASQLAPLKVSGKRCTLRSVTLERPYTLNAAYSGKVTRSCSPSLWTASRLADRSLVFSRSLGALAARQLRRLLAQAAESGVCGQRFSHSSTKSINKAHGGHPSLARNFRRWCLVKCISQVKYVSRPFLGTGLVRASQWGRRTGQSNQPAKMSRSTIPMIQQSRESP